MDSTELFVMIKIKYYLMIWLAEQIQKNKKWYISLDFPYSRKHWRSLNLTVRPPNKV